VVKEFLTTIDQKAGQIEQYASEGDFRNYAVTVHALKSSARLIGAMELSGMAAHLEECGNNEDEKEIREKTPELLELFRSYNEKLSAINGPAREDELPEIGEDELKSAFGDMKELLEAYDFDTADGIMNMLSEYRIPKEYKEKYEKVRTLMSAVDRDELLKIL
jgi:HPt (histidine-containing phosphotransfer) domain-containing protein